MRRTALWCTIGFVLLIAASFSQPADLAAFVGRWEFQARASNGALQPILIVEFAPKDGRLDASIVAYSGPGVSARIDRLSVAGNQLSFDLHVQLLVGFRGVRVGDH